MLSTEIRHLQHRAVTYLRTQDRPCTAPEIARDLFGAARQDDPVAHLLVRRLLEPLAEVIRSHDRCWIHRDASGLAVPLERARFVVIDLESTGSLIGVDRIIEVGVAVLEAGELVARHSSLVRCERRLPRRVRSLTGIDPEELRTAPPFATIARRLMADCDGAHAFVAHDVGFDYSFLRWELSRTGHRLRPLPGLCTLALARHLWPEREGWRLQDLASSHDIELARPHRAGDDATATALVLREELAAAAELGAVTLGDLYTLPAPAAASGASLRRISATG